MLAAFAEADITGREVTLLDARRWRAKSGVVLDRCGGTRLRRNQPGPSDSVATTSGGLPMRFKRRL